MKKIFTIAALMFSCIIVFGQSNIKFYSGEMKAPKDILCKFILNVSQGTGSYSYYESVDGQRIKHGKFEFRYSYNIFRYSVNGQYKDNKKEGVWLLTEYVKNNQELDKFMVTYKDNVLNGAYKGVLFDIFSKPAIICSGYLKDGHYFGEVNIETPGSKGIIKGSFNESGWAHGKWYIERNSGVPLKQEREYHEGFLLSVVEYDLASGEKNVLFELPKATISSIENTLNVSDSTLIISGERYKRIQDTRTYDDIDSRLFPNISGGKSVAEIFSEIYSPTMKEFIPLVNGFARMEKDYKWYEAKQEEERIAAEAKMAEDRRIAEEKRQEEISRREEERRIEAEKQKELKTLYQTALANHYTIAELYTKNNALLKELLKETVINPSSIKKPKIFNAYKMVYEQMDKNDAERIKNVIIIQEIVKQLINKKTKEVEKAIVNIRTGDDISSFFKNDAIRLCN